MPALLSPSLPLGMLLRVERGHFDPERALAEVAPDAVVVTRELEGCSGMVEPGPPVEVSLDYRLGRRERRAVLTHEVVHVERSAFYDRHSTRRVVEKLEAWIDTEACNRLVPPAELDDLARHADEHDVPLHVWDLMERFDVPMYVAHKAMALRERRRPWWPPVGES